MEVAPKIFIGSIHSAFNLDALLNNGITHILNASRLPITFPKQFTYLSVDIRDKGESNILSCIPTANIFIESGVDNGGVLVHCFGGKSRSAAFIAAYLMSTRDWSFEAAYAAIKSVRSVIDVNAGFECQLKAYALAGHDVYIAQQILLRSRIRSLHSLRGQLIPTISSLTSSEGKEVQQQQQQQHGSKQTEYDDKLNVHSYPPKVYFSDSVTCMREMSSNGVVEESSLHKRTWLDSKDSEGGCDTKESVGDMDVEIPQLQQQLLQQVDHDKVGVGPRLSRDRSRGSRGNSRSLGKLSNAEIDTKTPSCRLSRPGSNSVRVMPPLRGLEREFKCSWCNSSLFSLANVIRVDIDISHLLDGFRADDKTSNTLLGSDYKEDKDNNNNNKEDLESMPPPKGGLSVSRSARAAMTLSGEDMEMDVDDDNNDYNSAPSKHSHSLPLKSSKAQGSSFKGFDFDIPLIDLAAHNLDSSNNNDKSKEDSSSPLSARFAQQSFDDSLPLPTGRANLSIDVDKSSSSDSHPGNNNNNNNNSGLYTARTQQQQLQQQSQSQPSSARLVNQQSISYNNNIDHKSPKPSSPQQFYGFPTVSSRPSSATSTSLYSINNNNNNLHTFDESPRVLIPPHRMHETGWSPRDRPQSAEKRRWLARVNLLREGDTKVAKMAEDDDKASQLAFGRDKYLHIEYLPWMGNEVFSPDKDIGDICCVDCRRVVGSWIWKPSVRLLQDGKFEAPLFIIHKNVVHQSDVQFDATPSSTPRPIDL